MTSDPDTAVKKLIDNARTDAIIDEGRAKGRTDEEIANEIFSDMTPEDWTEMDRLYVIMTAFNEFSAQTNERHTTHDAMIGYRDLINGRTTDERFKFEEFLQSFSDSTMLGDALVFFCECCQVDSATSDMLSLFFMPRLNELLAQPKVD